MITVSDSIPIQFWDVNDETFNEEVVCGLNRQECYCQVFDYQDFIGIQIYSDAGANLLYQLAIYDSTDTEEAWLPFAFVSSTYLAITPFQWGSIDTVSFKITTRLINGAFDSPGAPWYNDAGAHTGIGVGTVTWTFAGGLALSGSVGAFAKSKGLIQKLNFPIGTRAYTINFEVKTNSGNISFVLFDDLGNALYIFNGAAAPGESPRSNGPENYIVGTYSITRTLTTTRIYGFIGVQVGGDGIGNRSVEISSITITPEPITVFKKSDCIQFKAGPDCTKLISYTNSSNFDGINYETAPITLYCRFPALMYKSKNPKEQEDLELSNGVVVTLRSSIQQKKMFEHGFIPDYMVLKFQKILMHETVTIDGIQWKQRDPYDDKQVDKYNLKPGAVLLTKYNSVEKNTI